MSQAINGVGTIFQRWNGSAWVHIAEIKSIDGPSKTRDTIETTNLDTTGGYKTFIASFRDAGTVQLSMNFTRATYELMDDDFASETLKNYEIILPDSEVTSIEFEGLVTELGLSITTGDVVSAPVTIKVSGAPVMNSGSGSN